MDLRFGWMIPLLATASLSGCATAGKLEKVKLGMSKQEVVQAIGKPASISAQGGSEYLTYRLSETDDEAFLGIERPYFVRLIDGKVESFGRTGDFDSTKTPTTRVEQKLESPPDLFTELQKLKTLKDQGIITDTEFEVQKKKILNSQ